MIVAFHGRPGNAEAALFIAVIFLPGMVERLAEDVLRVQRQMIGHCRREFVVARIRHVTDSVDRRMHQVGDAIKSMECHGSGDTKFVRYVNDTPLSGSAHEYDEPTPP